MSGPVPAADHAAAGDGDVLETGASNYRHVRFLIDAVPPAVEDRAMRRIHVARGRRSGVGGQAGVSAQRDGGGQIGAGGQDEGPTAGIAGCIRGALGSHGVGGVPVPCGAIVQNVEGDR